MAPKKQMQETIPWHANEIHTIFEKFHSSEHGLSERESKKRLKHYGLNSVTARSSATFLYILVRQLNNPIIYVLLFCTLLAFFLGKYTDSLVVFSVVVLNTLIGFIQEYKAHSVIRALTSLMPHKTTVIRETNPHLIHTEQLVPGDCVLLQAGDLVPADVRLFSTKNLQCDESMLTGESLPVNKGIEVIATETPLAERRSMAFSGTHVTAGTALGIVVATGWHTEFGKVSTLLEQVQPLETPLSLSLRQIAKWITLAVLLVSLALFFIGYLRGSSLFDATLAAIALAVAAIPEGLPAVITIASSIGVRRMAQKEAIIRQLPAVEALGSTTIICTDKTGTLTYNEMTVQRLWIPSGFCFVSGGGFSLEGRFFPEDGVSFPAIKELIEAAILCSDALIEQKEGRFLPLGDPTEIALVIAGRKLDLPEKKLRDDWPRQDVIPFESERRMMASLNREAATGRQWIFIKGAPEEISLLSSKEEREKITAYADKLAQEGLRVLAVAKKEVVDSLAYLEESLLKEGYHFLGLIGMIDPPRKEVYAALKSCYEAGIQVKMITGDHPVTAEAIGRELGLLGEGRVVTGQEMNHLKPEDWHELSVRNHIFARSSPEHKLQLVKSLQNSGHVVAMTGDGVNDAPALKRADIGVAMGLKGSAVAKEAADMVLANDNFASIEAAVKEGRRVYDNLIKSLAFLFPTNLSQALIIIFALLFFPVAEGSTIHPILPIQILWINLVVAVALSLPLAFEPAEPNIMQRLPRQKTAPLLSRSLAIKTLYVSLTIALGTIALFLWEYSHALSQGIAQSRALAEAQTLAVTAMMFFQIFYLFYCRFLTDTVQAKRLFSNPFVFTGVVLVLIVQNLFIYVPTMHKLFHSAPLDALSWFICLLVTSLIFPVMTLRNWLKKRFFS